MLGTLKFDAGEYKAAIQVLLDEWFNFRTKKEESSKRILQRNLAVIRNYDK